MGDWVLFGLADSSGGNHTLDSTASTSDSHTRSLPHHGGHQIERTAIVRRANTFNTGPALSARNSSQVLNNVATHSSGNGFSSYNLNESIGSLAPNFSASEAESDTHEVHHEQHAQNIPLALPVTSPRQQVLTESSLSSHDTSYLDEDGSSINRESRPRQRNFTASATSMLSTQADAGLAPPGQEPAHRIEVIPEQEALWGLNISIHYHHPNSPTENNNGYPGDLEEIDIDETDTEEQDLNTHEVPSSFELPNGGVILQPAVESTPLKNPGGSCYKELARKKTQEQKIARRVERTAELINIDDGGCSSLLGHKSMYEESRSWRTNECHERIGYFIQLASPSWYLDGCTLPFSVEALTSSVYPAFAFTHLTPHSVVTFTSKLAPSGLTSTIQHSISLSLGFGPSYRHRVCTFAPCNTQDLHIYRKVPGNDTLQISQSLAIAIPDFSPELVFKDLDVWLDGVIGSKAHLQGFADLMQRKKKGNLSVQGLSSILSWYTESESNASDNENTIFQAALKLVMTINLLNLVPKLDEIPDSLANDLFPRPSPSNTELSPIAPKLLTRQVKASMHHLQQELFHILFWYLSDDLQLAAEFKVAITLLMAFVLELAERAGQQFAIYANKINDTVQVKPEDVTKYESDMERQVFDRLRAKVLGTNVGQLGQLGGKLHGLTSVVNSNVADSNDQECRYVRAILQTVL